MPTNLVGNSINKKLMSAKNLLKTRTECLIYLRFLLKLIKAFLHKIKYSKEN